MADEELTQQALLYCAPRVTPRNLPAIEQIRTVSNQLGHPEREFRTMHIAGTSGKTSTAYFAESILRSSGVRTGMTVSPHIRSIRERVQINGNYVDPAEFRDAMRTVAVASRTSGTLLSFFEFVLATALLSFAAAGVEVAVIETGIGGLCDATNTIDLPSKTCVITDIGLDHVDKLGATRGLIAEQKAGIIHPGNTAFVLAQDAEVLEPLRARAADTGATLVVLETLGRGAADAGPEPAESFQKRNWRLALESCAFVLAATNDELASPEVLRRIAEHVRPPARMQVLPSQLTGIGSDVVIDGAHNVQKLQALHAELNRSYGSTKFVVVANLLRAHDTKAQECLDVLCPRVASLHIPKFVGGQDWPRPGYDAEALASLARFSGFSRVTSHEELGSALEEAKREAEWTRLPVLVTGSLYLAGAALNTWET